MSDNQLINAKQQEIEEAQALIEKIKNDPHRKHHIQQLKIKIEKAQELISFLNTQ